ncbi:hypothetical protein CSIRO_2787 [Bradyrhizobiaceae bacterium SG-6C]|nr:hypothetical protein CSIRO_2787 [Bradyrhizobiaceae bacterium SG-6C]
MGRLEQWKANMEALDELKDAPIDDAVLPKSTAAVTTEA